MISGICFPSTKETSEIVYCIQSLKNLKGVSIASINICHLVPKIDDTRIILEKSDLDVLCVNETFLDENILDGEIAIEGLIFCMQIAQKTQAKPAKAASWHIIKILELYTHYMMQQSVALISNAAGLNCTFQGHAQLLSAVYIELQIQSLPKACPN